jgi:Zn-dependent protease
MIDNLFINTLSSNPTYFFAVVISVVISITLHELAHGWVAIRNGDDTPIVTGHMTLNPLVHMGAFSLILLAVAGIAFGAMPVDPTRLRGKYAESRVALAGPAVNLILGVLALVSLAVWSVLGGPSSYDGESPASRGAFFLWIFGRLNLALMIFNLLPIPPLDGSHVAANVSRSYQRWMSGDMVRGVMQAVFFAVFIGAGAFIVRLADYAAVSIIIAVAYVMARLGLA